MVNYKTSISFLKVYRNLIFIHQLSPEKIATQAVNCLLDWVRVIRLYCHSYVPLGKHEK